MKVIKVSVEYQIGDEVYVRTDPEQRKFIVTGLTLSPKEVVYTIYSNGEEMNCYDFEMSEEKDALIKL